MRSGNYVSRFKALFRVDASQAIGSGHLFRCLALATCLRDQGLSIAFACAPLPRSMSELITKEEFNLITISAGSKWSARENTEQPFGHRDQESDAAALINSGHLSGSGWVVVDHYGLDEHWENIIRPHCERMLVIDDLANRRHVCDLLLDQNLGSRKRGQYNFLTPSNTRLLLGPAHALLRLEFATKRAKTMPRRGDVSRILVSFGGTDPTNETAKTVRALRRVPRLPGGIDVVAGGGNPHGEILARICLEDNRVRFHRAVSNMAELMSRSDLAIGACGATSWERCALFVPTVATIVAENQREIGDGLSHVGAAEVLGWHEEVTLEDIEAAVVDLCGAPDRIRKMSNAAGALVDGRGAKKVLCEMEAAHASPRLLH